MMTIKEFKQDVKQSYALKKAISDFFAKRGKQLEKDLNSWKIVSGVKRGKSR
jgi:hypothetical protein